MRSAASKSNSQASLVTALSMPQGHAANVRCDTPISTNRVSDHTMDYLTEARDQLEQLTLVKCTITCEISNLVYLIKCTKCNQYYVGETGRAFRKRKYEHIQNVCSPSENRQTPVCEHFNSDAHSHRHMQFSVLEWCAMKTSNPDMLHWISRRMDLVFAPTQSTWH